MEWKKAKTDYEKGMSYRDIATKYKCKYGTVRVHARRHEWKRIDVPLNTKKTKKAVTHVTKKSTKSVTDTDEDVTPVTNDDTKMLSPENEHYCQLRAINKLPIYKAYQVSHPNSKSKRNGLMSLGSALEKKKEIKLRIIEIQDDAFKNSGWTFQSVIQQLTDIYQEAKASIYDDGLKKANSDAAVNVLDRIVNLLGIDPNMNAQLKKIQAETKIKSLQAKALDTNDNAQMSQLSKLMNQLEDDD